MYGVRDYWTLPERYGDCEDYALLKRKLLIDAGIPSSELCMTICYTEEGEGHAVLSIDDGPETLILDNRFNELKTYKELKSYGYKFIKRQQGKSWVKIAP